jgi:hypothetical protein
LALFPLDFGFGPSPPLQLFIYNPHMFGRFVFGLLLTTTLLVAQSASTVAGDYEGTFQGFRIVLHLVAAADGKLNGTVDNTTQNILSVPCSDIHLDGQTLNFSVPSYNGKWAGFVTGNGTLSGMWSQGQPVQLNFTRIVAASSAGGAPRASSSPGEVQWDDYTFKIIQAGQMVQAFQGGRVVGTILNMNGQERVVAQPDTDADKLKKSYDDYLAFTARSHGASPPPAPSGPAGAAPSGAVAPSSLTPPQSATPPVGGVTPGQAGGDPAPTVDISAIRFDNGGKSVTVPRSDGTSVVFVGQDVKITGVGGRPGYLLRHQKGSLMRGLEQSMDHSHAVGGGVMGGGIEFLHEGGGLIYDSGMGGYNVQESPQTLKAKQLSQIAVDAVAEVRKVAGHESFKPPGYDSILEVSRYRLRSDGSR